ncbi:MAG: nuclear transport factor 2 family protein, partial [Rhodospirillales bacterium]
MIFSDLLARFTAAVETGDGTELGKLFTLDGVYHDTFYGEFQGPAAIKNMLENHFWRDAEAF